MEDVRLQNEKQQNVSTQRSGKKWTKSTTQAIPAAIGIAGGLTK
jgi:hypothetical protein